MCQNRSISFSVDPGGAKKKFAHLVHSRYNYDMQSNSVPATCHLTRLGLGNLVLLETARTLRWMARHQRNPQGHILLRNLTLHVIIIPGVSKIRRFF